MMLICLISVIALGARSPISLFSLFRIPREKRFILVEVLRPDCIADFIIVFLIFCPLARPYVLSVLPPMYLSNPCVSPLSFRLSINNFLILLKYKDSGHRYYLKGISLVFDVCAVLY